MSPASAVLDGMTLGAAAAGGALSGSAAGAAITRWPNGLTLGAPARSRCDACGSSIRARDLIPIVSWLALRGRCRSCRAVIDARHLALELLAATLAVLVVSVHGPTVRALLLLLGAVALLVATATDIADRIIPDRLTRPLAIIGVGGLGLAWAAGAVAPGPARVALAWSLGVPAALWVLTLVVDRRGQARPVGGGDIKLLIGVLAIAGLVPSGAPRVLLMTVVIAGSIASVGLLAGRLHRRSRMPLAPAITAAFLLVVLTPASMSDTVAAIGGPTWFR